MHWRPSNRPPRSLSHSHWSTFTIWVMGFSNLLVHQLGVIIEGYHYGPAMLLWVWTLKLLESAKSYTPFLRSNHWLLITPWGYWTHDPWPWSSLTIRNPSHAVGLNRGLKLWNGGFGILRKWYTQEWEKPGPSGVLQPWKDLGHHGEISGMILYPLGI